MLSAAKYDKGGVMKKAGILILEDELIVAEDLSGGLKTEGYEVVAKVSNAD